MIIFYLGMMHKNDTTFVRIIRAECFFLTYPNFPKFHTSINDVYEVKIISH